MTPPLTPPAEGQVWQVTSKGVRFAEAGGNDLIWRELEVETKFAVNKSMPGAWYDFWEVLVWGKKMYIPGSDITLGCTLLGDP